MGVSSGVQANRRPAQPVRPTVTRSDDSGGRTRFLTLLTRHPAGQLLVFQFNTRETRPEPKFMQYPPIFPDSSPFSLKFVDFWHNKHRI